MATRGKSTKLSQIFLREIGFINSHRTNFNYGSTDNSVKRTAVSEINWYRDMGEIEITDLSSGEKTIYLDKYLISYKRSI